MRAATLAVLVLVGIQLSNASADTERVRLTTVFWMHIQKTSSWLGNFLLSWGCESVRLRSRSVSLQPLSYSALAKTLPSLECEANYYTGKFQFGYHVPHTGSMNGTTVTLFRNPYSRVISSFLYGKGVHQMMFPLGFPDRAKVKFGLRDKIRASPYPVLAYARLPGIASCQTKMVLGMECGEPITIEQTQLEEAFRRIRYDFAFVGLTEESDASARLFLAMYSPTTSPKISVDEEEEMLRGLHSAPRVNSQHTSLVNSELLSVLREHEWRDAADEHTYHAAVELFFERCAHYGISTKRTKEELLQL
jgi:hypothetical protein